jgi:hypothetical protein
MAYLLVHMTIILMTVAKPSLPLKTLQVLIDPTVVGFLRLDLTAETCPPIELLSVAPDRCHASFQIDDPDYVGISPWLFPMVNLVQLLSDLTALVLSGNLNEILWLWIFVFLLLCKSTPALNICAASPNPTAVGIFE